MGFLWKFLICSGTWHWRIVFIRISIYVTFVGVLSACAHLGWVREGYYYLNQLMYDMGIQPGLEHYTCIVGVLCKAGLVEQAENFMRTTPLGRDVVALRTMANACYVHGNYQLGKQVAETILDTDPDDMGTYILLSKMHAKANRWDGVARIRKLMRERKLKEEPGISWIEIRNHTHVFVDNKSPEFSQIYEKVRELLAEIEPLGYVQDIATVVHDVEKEQKEELISYHGEKLAVAYGIMRTPPEATIRVIKKQTMCDDCHSAVKLISKVANRTIIVKDVNHFHRFQDGFCSCGDYW